ncbi:hypothetical protein GCM10020331_027120 [Ectobacillus funiculus]
MVWAAILLLPKVLILPIILVAAYLAYKKNGRNEDVSSANYVQAEAAGVSSLDSHKLDYLDEWENKIHKEEQ